VKARAVGVAGVAVLLAVPTFGVLTGCAVPEGSEARPVDSDIAALLSPEATPTPSEVLPPRRVWVTWVKGNKLEQLGRFVPASTREELFDGAMLELRLGPRPTEQIEGFRTLLPIDLEIDGDLRGRVAAIDLDVTTQTQQSGVELAVGQIATTALSIQGVRSVVFSVDGEATRVPVPDRNRDVRVVRASNYRTLLR
jgi:hypothetical protein